MSFDCTIYLSKKHFKEVLQSWNANMKHLKSKVETQTLYSMERPYNHTIHDVIFLWWNYLTGLWFLNIPSQFWLIQINMSSQI
jgi:hypothetical protein